MQKIKNILKSLNVQGSELSEEEYNRLKEDSYNKTSGSLNITDGYDCPRCKNRGNFLRIDEQGNERIIHCECLAIRKNIRALNNSGLKDAYLKYKLSNFKADNPFQAAMLKMANDFLKVYKDKWFYIGGQIGCGKTHICTGVCGKLIEQGIPVKYISWRTEVNKLKQNITDEERYQRMLSELKNIEVLYIDDLSKGGMSEADVKILFEIIDYRYHNVGLTTIISSEKAIEELMNIDEAIASRIYEKSKGFYISIKADKQKNYRIYGGK